MLETAGDLLFLSAFSLYFPLRYRSSPAGNVDLRGSVGTEGLMWEKKE